MDKELIKTIMFEKFLLKAILKKVYNLSNQQYERIVRLFEDDSEKEAAKYLKGIEQRAEFKKNCEVIEKESEKE